jgi:predicted nuclease of restriction endonuclease-like RecB superfamily
MKKKIDVSKILAKGSANQRALLYFNNIGKGFLTEAEERQLLESFKTESEINLYNRYNKLLKAIMF